VNDNLLRKGVVYCTMNTGGSPLAKGMIPEPLPLEWCQPVFDRLCAEKVFPVSPNHILVNEYLPGQGIMVTLDWLLNDVLSPYIVNCC